MKVVIKNPGELPIAADIDNDLKTLQKLVGGYIETVTVNDVGGEFLIVCNEEGLFTPECEYNCAAYGHEFYGTIVLCGVYGDDFCDLPESYIEWFTEV